MIYFDLDGVLRDIHKTISWKPETWEEKYDGKTIVNYFASKPKLLAFAPVTEYFSVIVSYFDVNIITAIPDEWTEPTLFWISKNLKGKIKSIIFAEHLKKLCYLKENDILVEDCPRYNCYSQIILIDKSYNRDINLPHTRVHTPKELLAILLRHLRSGSCSA